MCGGVAALFLRNNRVPLPMSRSYFSKTLDKNGEV